MVTIVDCVKRVSNDGEEFIAFIVQDELELVKSKHANFYVTAHRASVPCTLDMESARLMLGKTLPGRIEKVECPAYETVNSGGELVTLNQRWQYIPEENRTEVEQKQVITLDELEPETV